VKRYPLAWPDGWRRTSPSERKHGLFGKRDKRRTEGENPHEYYEFKEVSISEGTQRVVRALEMLNVHEGIISTNLKLRLDGLPRSDQAAPSDPGVAVYWTNKNHQHVMAIDRYDRVADNLAAIAATLEAMRAIDRHGGAQILERAFTGFEALPAPADWRRVFCLKGDAIPSKEALASTYRALARKRHPDVAGGSHEKMAELNRAYDAAKKELML